MRTAAILVTALLLASCKGDTSTSPAVFTVIVTAPKQTIAVGEPVQLVATARDVNGVTIGGAKFSFSSSAPGVASVNADGRVIGVSAGSASITATSSGLTSAPLPITVLPSDVAAVITMAPNAFFPAQATIRVNQTVMFDFPASPQHNVIFQQRAGKPADIPATAGVQVKRTFASVGTFPYDCQLHPGMSGQVIVNP